MKATAKTDDVNYKILATASASPTSGNATEAVYDTDITLNPSTNSIAANISGSSASCTGNAATATTAQNYDTSTGTIKTALDGKVDFGLSNNTSNIGNDAPAADCISYWSSNNIPDNHIKMVYNQPGAEATLIFSKRSTYGSIVKYGYADKYIYILRNQNSTWKSNDWEKISAGYADSAGTATTAQNYDTSTGTIKTALEGKRDIYGDFYGEGTTIYGWKIGQMALGTSGSANGYMTAIVRIDRWTKLENGDRDFDSFFGVVKLWARNSSDGTTTWPKATIHSFKPTAFSSTGRGYAIFKKSSNSGHTIDWYIGLAPDSDSTYTPKKEIAYSLIEISPMCEVNFTRGLERVSSDPGFDSWMDNCTRGPWLAYNQYGAGSSSLPVYVDADNKVVGVDPKLTQGNLIRSLDTWSNINETDEYIPVANNSATAQYPHGRYSFAKIWAWIKGKLTSVDGVDISGNAATVICPVLRTVMTVSCSMVSMSTDR